MTFQMKFLLAFWDFLLHRLGKKKICEFTVMRPTQIFGRFLLHFQKTIIFKYHIFAFKQSFQHVHDVWDHYCGNKGAILTHGW